MPKLSDLVWIIPFTGALVAFGMAFSVSETMNPALAAKNNNTCHVIHFHNGSPIGTWTTTTNSILANDERLTFIENHTNRKIIISGDYQVVEAMDDDEKANLDADLLKSLQQPRLESPHQWSPDELPVPSLVHEPIPEVEILDQ